jgi:hypothetical protein
MRPGSQVLIVVLLLAASGCGGGSSPPPPPPDPPFEPGTEIVACGERFDIGAPVVLWTDRPGFDGYLERCRFRDDVLPGDGTRMPGGEATPPPLPTCNPSSANS